MIIRRQLTANYTAIPNNVVTDQRMSIEARWLLTYLLTKPHNWVVRITDIRNSGGIGRDKAYALLKELCEIGYIKKVESREEGGTYTNVEYIVSDSTKTTFDGQNQPFPDLPDTVNTEPSKDLSLQSTDTLVTNVTRDARDRLWQEIPRISKVTGIPEKRLRPIIGKWLKILGDNAEVLNKVLAEAVEHRPADFVSWVTATVQGYANKEGQSKNWLDLWK